MRRLVVCLVAGCVVGLCAAGVSAQEVFKVCVKDSNGSMRIVEGPED